MKKAPLPRQGEIGWISNAYEPPRLKGVVQAAAWRASREPIQVVDRACQSCAGCARAGSSGDVAWAGEVEFYGWERGGDLTQCLLQYSKERFGQNRRW